MMKAIVGTVVVSITVLGFAGASSAQVLLYDFESGAAGWGSFGPLTTDSGQNAGDTGLARFHTGNFDMAGWGMLDISPVNDLSSFVGMSMDARLRDVAGQTPYGGTKLVNFGLDIGGTEYMSQISLTSAFQTFSVNFADLVPVPPSLNAVQIKLVILDGLNGSTGVGEINIDNVTGLVPEPSTAALLGFGLVMFLRRRR